MHSIPWQRPHGLLAVQRGAGHRPSSAAWYATGIAAWIAVAGLACDAPRRETPATFDLFAAELAGECRTEPVEWQTTSVGPTQHRGFHARPGDVCHFEVALPPDSTLAMRVVRGGAGDAFAPPMQVGILADMGGEAHSIFNASIGAGEEIIEAALPLPDGLTRLLFAVQGGGRNRPAANVAWTDLFIATHHGGKLDRERFAIPLSEALDDYLAASDWSARPADDASPRMLVIGIDGASWPLLDALIAEGFMPNLAALRARGLRGVLESSVIPESAMAWTTMRTGVRPGKHGVTFFISPDTARSSYWQWLSDAGLRSIILGVPKSRTNEDFEGVLVGGWNFSREYQYARPIPLKIALDRAHFDPLIVYMRNVDYFAQRMSQRTDLFLQLGETIDWDHAFVVYEYSDTASHIFGLETPEWKQSYAAVDREIGRLLGAIGPETTLLLVSDHGWRRYAGSVAPGAWLRAHAFEGWLPHIYSGNRAGVRAEPRPAAEVEAAELLQIESALADIVEPSTGRPLVRRFIPASEAFAGPFSDEIPTRGIIDLVPDYHAAGKDAREEIVVEAPIEHHASEGFYLIVGPGIEPGEGRVASVVDVAPTVAGFFGASTPDDLDGRSLFDFGHTPAGATRAGERGRQTEEHAAPTASEPGASEASEDLRERLRALGYVDE